MPRYCYRCDDCGQEIEVRHGMSDRLSDCEECSMVDSLIRIPQLTFKLEIKKQNEQVGSKVNDAINENRQLLKQMKKEGRLDDLD